MILGDFDKERQAVINPDMIFDRDKNCPETFVSIFSHILFNEIIEFLGAEVFAYTKDVDGEHPIYRATYKGKTIGLVKARLGEPSCVGHFEDIGALGGKRFILMGNCGVLTDEIKDCGIIIPTRAIRDEGTSYHYMEASDTLEVNHKYRDVFKELCDLHGYAYTEGTTWTTDAFYRETPDKVASRKEMGAVCVEMECAGMQAMCDFRGFDFFQFFYAGDSLAGANWDPRSLSSDKRLDYKSQIALLALELAVKIEEMS